ncbi:MAG: sulfur carrier protein ThiS [Verrucomicrobia bacterium]|nr:sulfur carrier protein ThiS [bacterium]NDA09288.1 sulfur carrier protein ThiS [Verrucomicrobiota bacterium]NDA25390.1 sulfur carrier protein ThiS [Verrucomicrobiota bacterium]NDD56285.1 sulfur carrier protein ThiS [Verrucomicrobiota bacterium]NDD81204.1 sulfur carrier protein ThiS [Verrucomicrobiota bacterium]
MANKVTIFANGRARQVDPEKTIAAMIQDLRLTPAAVLVERNGRALLRQEWEKEKVEHGDRLEFVKVVAGG